MILVDSEKCIGCRICELVCSAHHEGIFFPEKSRVKIMSKGPLEDVPTLCRQCDEPPCVRECPSDALIRSDHGVISVEEGKCEGCGICVSTCPYNAISLDPDTKKPLICDLCSGDPMCAKWCPRKALKFNE